MSRKRILIIVGIVLVLGAALLTHGFGLFAGHAPKTLTLSGNVEIRQVDLGFRLGGRITSIPYDEGSRVVEGAVLASLDVRPLKDKLAANDGQLAAAVAAYQRQQNGNRRQDVAQAEAKLAEQRAQFIKAQQDLDRRSTLLSTGAISQAVLDSTRAQLATAEAQLHAAEQAVSLQKAGARREDIEAAHAQQQEAFAQRSATLTDIADSELRAPNDGVVLTRAREPGAIVLAGETVLTLTIDRPVRIRAYIEETDLSRVSPGMAVEVLLDGAQHIYHGTIGNIAPTAEFTPKTVQTENLRSDLVYRVRVIVDDPDEGLRQGQPASVRVPGARPAARKP